MPGDDERRVHSHAHDDDHSHAHGFDPALGHHHDAGSISHSIAETALDRLRAIGEATRHAIRHHWLAGVNGLLGTLIGVAALVPVGYALGLTGPCDAIFHAYRIICGQTPSHSFYIGGYQMCLCSRCLAIYSSLLLGGLLLALLRHSRQIRGLGWKFWLLAMVPMALDGGTQLFGLRESNLALRIFTGALFGLATAWFLFPQIEDASREVPTAPPGYAWPPVAPDDLRT